MFVTEAKIDDILGSPIGPKPALHREAEGAKHTEVEGEGAVNIRDRKVDVVDASYGHQASIATVCRTLPGAAGGVVASRHG